MGVHEPEYKDGDPEHYTDFRQQVRLLGYDFARELYLRRELRLRRRRRVLVGILLAVAVAGLSLQL